MIARILIIEDEPLIARDLKRIVLKYGYKVAGVYYNSDNALDGLVKTDYDIVLLDINLKGSRNGIQLAQLINEKYKKPFIFITSYADRDTLDKVKLTRPSGYIVKPFNEKEIFSALEITNYKYLIDSVDVDKLSIENINKIAIKPITHKEFEIILHIIDGKTNRQLASIHYISENTIKSHIKSIYKKLEVHSKPELVARVFLK